MRVEKANFDWSQQTSVPVFSRKGNLSLMEAPLSPADVLAAKVRCIWPKYRETVETRYLSRRIKGQRISL